MKVLPLLRRAAVAIVVAAVVAGCAVAPQENQPGDLNCDGDRDGIPDGQSPVEGTNSTCDEPPGEQNTDELPTNTTDDNATPTMPGVVPG